ncbi:hypothetical protein [Pseudonocardia dioxanivorans]|uniref:hypothetical protein n=1 Tax=Pseudonocardia dioxanivorans TaxID=240495 RepID=UPI001313DB6A|nr:hypothetical protein [Pseudonocardia dioxanivorans]
MFGLPNRHCTRNVRLKPAGIVQKWIFLTVSSGTRLMPANTEKTISWQHLM